MYARCSHPAQFVAWDAMNNKPFCYACWQNCERWIHYHRHRPANGQRCQVWIYNQGQGCGYLHNATFVIEEYKKTKRIVFINDKGAALDPIASGWHYVFFWRPLPDDPTPEEIEAAIQYQNGRVFKAHQLLNELKP